MATLYYPELIKNSEAFPAHILFTFFERQSTQSSSPQDFIHLYMPESFGQPNTVSWDSSFKAGQAVAGTLSAAKNLLTGGRNLLGPGFSAFLRQAQSVGAAAKDLGSIASGMHLNPYYAQLFRSVDFRNFRYTFRFTPFSPGDCDTILEIINTFRRWSLPKSPTGSSLFSLFEYPGECEIDYIFDSAPNRWLHFFKRSVITSLDINYTGAGIWTMMRNGFPTETVMNVTFSEIEIVLRDDVDAGF